MKATYVSVWDSGFEVRTSCEFDINTKNITDIETADIEGLEILEREYIELPDGTEIAVEDCLVDGVGSEDEEETVPELRDAVLRNGSKILDK